MNMFFPGSENESKIFVCTSKSQLIAKSDVCNTMSVIDAKVDLVLSVNVYRVLLLVIQSAVI